MDISTRTRIIIYAVAVAVATWVGVLVYDMTGSLLADALAAGATSCALIFVGLTVARARGRIR